MSQRLSPLRGGSSGASSAVVGYRRLHRDHSETSDLHNSRTYAGFTNGLAAEKGATSSFIVKDATPRTKMVTRLEPCFSEYDENETKANPKVRIQDQRRTSFDTLALGRVTFATFTDSSADAVTPSIISTPEHDSDFSLRNDSTLEKSTAELEAVRDSTNFTREFQDYDERRAERNKGKKAERRVRFAEETEPQDSMRERFHTPEPTPSRTQDARPNLQKGSLSKRSMVASGGSAVRLQLDGEVNQVQPSSANPKSRSPIAKKAPQVGRKKRRRLVVGEIFPCKICHCPFTNKRSAYRHAHTHLNSDELEQSSNFHAKCPHCQKVFFDRQHFTEHVNSHEGRKNHDCPVCKKKFITKSHLTSHLFVHLSREEQAEVKRGWRHGCYFCHKRFKTPSHLSRHIGGHTKEKVGGRCPICRKAFSSKRTLTRHRFLHLSEDEKTALVEQGSSRVCLFCRKKFPDNRTYQSHLVTHIPEKPFRCDQCGKLFARNSDLTEHKRIHSANPKPFKCDECGHVFCHKHHLTRHTKTVHRKLKGVACPECPKKFGRKSVMVKHLNSIHVKIRHPCHYCSQTFAGKSGVCSHVKVAHPPRE